MKKRSWQTPMKTMATKSMDEHLRQSIEALHECTAAHEAVPVSESLQGPPGWEGVVHTFSLIIEGSEKRKIYAVLEVPPVVTAVDAVRAAIIAEHREKCGG